MLKIQKTAVAAALRPSGGRAMRRLLAPSATSLMLDLDLYKGTAVAQGNQSCHYHSQTFPQQQSTASSAEKTMALPPNLMFDFKSSFAPQKKVPAASELAASLEEEDDAGGEGTIDDHSESNDVAEDEFDDDEDEFDEDAPLVFQANATNHRQVVPLPDRLNVPIRDGPATSEDESVGTVWLDPTVFGVEDIRIDLITQNVNYIRNKIRGVRKAKTKTISEKSGSGRKVRPQKGGGQARAGHSRPAHWRGGAKAHGPKNTKDYGNTKLNKRVKALAMRSMLSQKLKEGNLVVVNHLQLDSHRTGPWSKILENGYGVGKALKKTKLRNNDDLAQTTSALILDHFLEQEGVDEEESGYHASYHGVPINLWVASSNIPRVTVRNHRFLNVYDCLKNEKLIITLAALEQIEEKWRD